MNKELILAVKSPKTLNEFLRAQLPKLLQDQNSSQDQNAAACAQSAVSNSKIRRLIFSQNVWVDAGGANRNASQDQKARRARDSWQAQNGGGFAVCKNPSLFLQSGARVKVFLDPDKFFYQKQNGDIEFELDGSRVLYEDDAIIVVNKPPHFPTEPTFVQDRDNLRQAVIRYLHKKIGLEKNPPYCGIVHRLDRDTSGAIVFSKKRSCNAALFKAFDSSGTEAGSLGLASDFGKTQKAAAPFGLENDLGERAAQKIYVALCAPAAGEKSYGLSKTFGKTEKAAPRYGLASDSFSVQNYLGRVSAKSEAAKWGSVAKERGGKFARTDFKVLKKGGGLFLVEAKLWTGRTHQIRVHLAQSGLPILGDELYGGRPAERIFLHAQSLALPHPESGQIMRFEAPLPPEFAAAF